MRRLLLFCSIFSLYATAGIASELADIHYESAIRLERSADLHEVFEQYARAAELGHPIAQYNLAMMYSNGESVNVDYQQSVYWFNKSADQGFPPAQHRLGEMYYFGRGGVSRDISRAVSLFLLAAKQNDPDAQMNLAMLYGTGEGVPADTYEAFRWLEKANALGDESATAYQRMLSASDNGKFTVEQHNTFWAEKAEELGLPGKTPYSNRITGS
jgi:TPR repeat protein